MYVYRPVHLYVHLYLGTKVHAHMRTWVGWGVCMDVGMLGCNHSRVCMFAIYCKYVWKYACNFVGTYVYYL